MLKLIDDYNQYKKQIIEMLDEWSVLETMIPYSIRRIDYHDFEEYVAGFAEEKIGIPGFVPALTYFLYDEERDKILGAAHLRLGLNDHLFQYGGHLGDGIRPSERQKGYGTKLVALSLQRFKELGFDKILMVCNKENIGSAKTILKNGGVLENEVISEKGNLNQRYWITL